MLELEYFLVSEAAVIDQMTNQVSIFNVIDELALSEPGAAPSLVATSCWVVGEEDKEQDWRVQVRVSGCGVDHKAKPLNMFFPSDSKTQRHRTIHRFGGMPIKESGELRFEILLEDEEKASHRIGVTIGAKEDVSRGAKG